MKYIPLTQNQYAIVDDENYEELSRHKWSAQKHNGGFRAIRNIFLPNGNWATIYMHRQIMNAPDGMQVDHINHQTLDNRKINLRLCTNAQNNQNRLSDKGSSSKYKGVSWKKQTRRWQAHIRVNDNLIHLGYFDNEEDAAKAYDKAATKHFGEFAYLNLHKDYVKVIR